jgi:hypothetical protein
MIDLVKRFFSKATAEVSKDATQKTEHDQLIDAKLKVLHAS